MKKTSPRAGETTATLDVMDALRAVADMADSSIDRSDPDAPEVADWAGAERGRFYRPVKTLKSLRLDADVLAYFQAEGPGYQTRINQVLRESMLRGMRERQASIEGAPRRKG